MRFTRSSLAAALPPLAAMLVLAWPAPADVTRDEARKWKPDLAAARDYAEDRAGEVGLAVFDMAGRLHHHRGGGSARMASTFKVMLLVAYLRQDSVDDRALTRGDKALLRPMIRRSDNAAASRIDAMLGRAPIEALADRTRMKHFRWHDIWGLCRTSARDQAFFLRNLRRYVPARHWDFAKRQLARIVGWQRWGIGQVELPPGWELHFKGGWGSGTGAVDHQVALLRNGKRRLGIGVLTESSPSHDYGKETLEGVFRRLLRDLPR